MTCNSRHPMGLGGLYVFRAPKLLCGFYVLFLKKALYMGWGGFVRISHIQGFLQAPIQGVYALFLFWCICIKTRRLNIFVEWLPWCPCLSKKEYVHVPARRQKEHIYIPYTRARRQNSFCLFYILMGCIYPCIGAILVSLYNTWGRAYLLSFLVSL